MPFNPKYTPQPLDMLRMGDLRYRFEVEHDSTLRLLYTIGFVAMRDGPRQTISEVVKNCERSIAGAVENFPITEEEGRQMVQEGAYDALIDIRP